MSKLQTTNYAGWDGKIRFGLDPSDSGVETWINEGTGTITVEMPFDGPHWQYLGVAPLPMAGGNEIQHQQLAQLEEAQWSMETRRKVRKTQNGHAMDFIPIQGQGEAVEEILVWCRTCDPDGTQMIFQRDVQTRAEQEQALQDAVVQAKLHAVVDVTSN